MRTITKEIKIYDITDIEGEKHPEVKARIIENWEVGGIYFEQHWQDEINESYRKAKEYIEGLEEETDLTGHQLHEYLKENHDIQEDCFLTGITFDHDFLQPLFDFMKEPSKNVTLDSLTPTEASWNIVHDREVTDQTTEMQILNHIRANNYEFTADGKIYSEE